MSVRSLAVHPWPGPLPRTTRGLIVIGVATPLTPIRDVARERIRVALQTVLGALLDRAPADVALISQPGQPLRLDLDNTKIRLSVSHEPGLSIAAVNLHGAVGIDLMQVQSVPDWEPLARAYLGEQTARRLAALPAERRPQAFAQAWTQLEASLKCHGLPLCEWNVQAQRWLSHSRAYALDLPQPLTGTLATIR